MMIRKRERPEDGQQIQSSLNPALVKGGKGDKSKFESIQSDQNS